MVKHMRIGIVFMIISAFLSATGQLLWKFGLNNFIWIIIGFIFYGLGALFMIKAFKLEKLSVAYPIMCVGYLISMIYGKLFLNETIGTNKIIAIFLIIFGVVFISYDE